MAFWKLMGVEMQLCMQHEQDMAKVDAMEAEGGEAPTPHLAYPKACTYTLRLA